VLNQLYHLAGLLLNNGLGQGGPRLQEGRATLRFEEKFAGHKEKTPMQLRDSFTVLVVLILAARLKQFLILG